MRKLISNSLLWIMILVSAVSAAQDQKWYESELGIRKAKLECLKLLDQVEIHSGLKGESLDEYDDLFIDNSVKIVNEVLPSNTINRPNRKEFYLDSLKKYDPKSDVQILRVTPYYSEFAYNSTGLPIIQVHAYKRLIYKGNQKIEYSDTLNLIYQFTESSFSGKFKITQILLKDQRAKYLIVKYSNGLNKVDSISLTVCINKSKKKIHQSEDGAYYTLLKDIKSDTILHIQAESDDIIGKSKFLVLLDNIGSDVNQGNYLKTGIHRKKWFVMPYFNHINEQGSYKTNDTEHTIDGTVTLIEYGLNFGRILKEYPIKSNKTPKQSEKKPLSVKDKRKLVLSGLGGIGHQKITYQLKSGIYQDQFETVDPGGQDYLRLVDLDNVIETNSTNMISLNLGLDSRLQLNRYWSLSFTGGLQLNMVASLNYKNSFVGEFNGYYKEYGDTLSSGSQYGDIYDFGQPTNIESDGKSQHQIFTYSWLFNFSSFHRITKRLYIAPSLTIRSLPNPYILNDEPFVIDEENTNSLLNYLKMGQEPLIGYGLLLKYYL